MGYLVETSATLDRDLLGTNSGDLIDSFLDCKVKLSPASRQLNDELVSEHDDKAMTACPCFEPDVDGTKLQFNGLGGAKRPLD